MIPDAILSPVACRLSPVACRRTGPDASGMIEGPVTISRIGSGGPITCGVPEINDRQQDDDFPARLAQASKPSVVLQKYDRQDFAKRIRRKTVSGEWCAD